MGARPILGLIAVPVKVATGLLYLGVKAESISKEKGPTPSTDLVSKVLEASNPRARLMLLIP